MNQTSYEVLSPPQVAAALIYLKNGDAFATLRPFSDHFVNRQQNKL